MTHHDHNVDCDLGIIFVLVGGHLGSKMKVSFWLQFLLQVEALGVILAPCWVSWTSFWPQVGGLGGYFGSKLEGRGHLGSNLGVFGAILIPS